MVCWGGGGGGGRRWGGVAGRFAALVITSTTKLSSHSAAAYLEALKRGSEKKRTLNQFHSPVNYNPAFLISSPPIQCYSLASKPNTRPPRPAQLRSTNCPLLCSLCTCLRHDWTHIFLDVERWQGVGEETAKNKGEQESRWDREREKVKSDDLHGWNLSLNGVYQ